MFGVLDQPRSPDPQPRQGREKYEFEASSGRPFINIAIGFVVFEAMLLLKNVLFGTKPGAVANASVPPTMGASEPTTPPDAVTSSEADQFVEQSEQQPPSLAEMLAWMAPKIGSSTFFVDQLGNVSLVSFVGGKPVSGPTLAVANDNRPAPFSAWHLPDSFQFPTSVRGAPGDSVPEPAATNDDDPAPSDGSERRNNAPVVSGDTIMYRALVGQTVVLGAAELLLFAHDIDGDPLSISSAKASVGAVEVDADGGLRYRPSSFDFHGTVLIEFEISDGEHSVSQIAQIDFSQIPGSEIIGTDAAETIVGTPGDDRILARSGSDVIVGREGDDLVDAGDGDDRVVGGSGNDVIHGGAGDDVLLGGEGDDTIYAGAGDDFVSGDAGDDVIFAGAGNDTAFGGDGADILQGEGGDDALYGGAGGDVALGGDGNDLLAGDSGDDLLDGGLGHDHVVGGAGDDVIVEYDPVGRDVLDGGDGRDTLDLSAAPVGAFVNLGGQELAFVDPSRSDPGSLASPFTDAPQVLTNDEPATAGAAPTSIETPPAIVLGSAVDAVLNVEDIKGTPHSDVLVGSEIGNALDGAAGDDLVSGGAGEDILRDGTGADIVLGGDGDDVIVATADQDEDRFDGGAGRDTLDLSAFKDGVVLDLSEGTVRAAAGGGATDEVARIEVFVLGVGRDVVVTGAGQADYYGGAGDDIYVIKDASSSGKGNGGRDRVMDFEPGDKIELSGLISALSPDLGKDLADNDIKRFVMIRDGQEFDRPGQLRLMYETDDDGTPVAILQGNLDRNSDVEFELEMRGFLEHQIDQIVY